MARPRLSARRAPRREAATPSRKGTGAKRVYEAIRQRILGLQLPPSSDLDEAELVKAYGVSRTPVREAMIRLASEGLVILLPNRGARVAPISLPSVREFFEALSLAQRAVTRWAAVRRVPERLADVHGHRLAFEAAAAKGDTEAMAATNREFHLAIADAAGNMYLRRLYAELLDQGMRLSRLALIYNPPTGLSREVHRTDIVAEHRRLVDAVVNGDAEAAEALASRHTERFRSRIMGYLGEHLADGIAVDTPAPSENSARGRLFPA
jgi:DNA-binding GntR family transcriptional regulator